MSIHFEFFAIVCSNALFERYLEKRTDLEGQHVLENHLNASADRDQTKWSYKGPYRARSSFA